jgi:WD40 repeat protein
VSAVLVVNISSLKRFVFTGSWDKSVRQYDLLTSQCLGVIAEHADTVKSLAFLSSSNVLLSGSFDGRLQSKQLNASKTEWKIHQRSVDALLPLEDGEHVLSGSSDSTLKRICVRTGQTSQSYIGHETSITDLKSDIDSDLMFYSCSLDKQALCWDVQVSTFSSFSTTILYSLVRECIV